MTAGLDPTSLLLRRAREADLPALVRLLGDAVPSCAADTVWALPWSWARYRVLEHRGRIVAAASLAPLADGRAEIRGVAIDSAYRGCGLGSRLVGELVDVAGCDVLCVTEIPGFFEKLGFTKTAPTWLSPQRRLRGVAGAPRVAMVARARREAA